MKIETYIEAAFEGLSGVEDLPQEGDGALIILEVMGDALRFGFPIPKKIQDWSRSVGLESVLERATQDVKAWPIPQALVDETSFWVQLRDGMESIRVAIFLISWELLDLPRGMGDLDLALKAYDGELVKAGTSAEAILCLGNRVDLLGENSWVDAFPEGPDVPEGPEVPMPFIPPEWLPIPSDSVVVAYASQGKFRAYIEGFAAKRPDFSRDLRDLLGALEQDGELDHPIPRAWLEGNPTT